MGIFKIGKSKGYTMYVQELVIVNVQELVIVNIFFFVSILVYIVYLNECMTVYLCINRTMNDFCYREM